jgi:putative tryptophan/tyrosine transport system substrate-binding protein
MFGMRRREVITLLGGAAAAWPVMARAQQPERLRRIGVLTNLAADDPEAQVRKHRLRAGVSAIGLDRRPKPADRKSLGCGRC